MSTIARLTIKYGSGPDGQHTLKKAFYVSNDPPDSPLGTPYIDYTVARNYPLAQRTVSEWAATYLGALARIAKSGTIIYSASADLLVVDEAFPGVIAFREYDLAPWVPTGDDAQWGPRGNAFLASPQPIPATGHKGWLRFYCTDKTIGNMPKTFASSAVSADFEAGIKGLQNFGSSSVLENKLEGYAVFTNVLFAAGSWTPQNVPSTQLRQGIVNG